ncbi:MAG: ABC transporter ATP-binding protein [Proteobacteria bacterium]|nr:ABC transporter ATP-binding protein [Pseudomonadota bacterium]
MTTERLLLELKAVSKSFGQTEVLQRIDLAVRDGEFITILGPSGSGKTTILRMIGGFESPSSGEILLDGADISALPINKRPFNTVFQDYALFPHMTVAANVGYGLKVRGVKNAEIETRVGEALQLVALRDFAGRFPAQLSGGQRQRVALARAIICRPRLILLDEPLAALDVELRRQMQSFLKDIQREIKTTFLFVTHDQEEAIAMADRICVMNSGHIQQLGSAHEVYYRPASEFVARFFGDNNLVEGRLGPSSGDRRRIETPLGALVCAIDGQPHLAAAPEGAAAYAVFRPEALSLASTGSSEENRAHGLVTGLHFAGAHTLTSIRAGGHEPVNLRLRLPSKVEGVALRAGEAADLYWRPSECRLVLK